MPNYRRLFVENSYVFITVVIEMRKPILIDNIELLRESFKEAKNVYDFKILASVVLPEHIHLIIIPVNIKEYPKIIRAIKYNFSRKIKVGGMAIPPYYDEKGRAGLLSCRHKNTWQRGYWEHTIRDEQDLNNHLDYIHYNPVKHGYVKSVKDWEFSSFHKFVESQNYENNWGSSEDIKHIETLDYD